jgi:hypothetical protein
MLKFTFTALLLLRAGAALAGQASVPIGFGFANACAGNQYFGSLPNPGDGFSTTTDAYMTCNTSMLATAAANAANSGVTNSVAWNNTASAFAEPGVIKVGATNTGAAITAFSGGAAYGGWNDTLVNNNGTGDAIWLIPIHVEGTLTATGTGALTRMGIAVYKNNNFLQPYGSTINSNAYAQFLSQNGGPSGVRNSVIAFSWDYQGAWFGADDYVGGGALPSYSLDRDIYFAIPITYGVPFTFGLYMGGLAGENASGGDPTVNSTVFDFTHTVTWGGPGFLLDADGNNPTAASGFQSASTFNYNAPYSDPSGVPEPGTAALVVLGSVAAFVYRRQRPA